jgi:hypothetical protein
VRTAGLIAVALALAACVLGGCGSGSDDSTSQAVVIGQQSAQFSIGVGGVKPQGASPWKGNVRLVSESNNGRDYSGVFPLPADSNLLVGNVAIENGTGGIITNVLAHVTSVTEGWEAREIDYGGGVTGWAYGAIPAGTTGAPAASSPQRWVFAWVGAGDPVDGTFSVQVTWDTATQMPAAGSSTIIALSITGTPTGVTVPYQTVPASTLSTATDGFDGIGTDSPPPPDPPGTNFCWYYFPHPEWNYTSGTDPVDRFVSDVRALLYPGQLKGWDFVLMANKTGTYTVQVDATGVPAGYSWVKVIDLQTGGEKLSLLPGATGTFTKNVTTKYLEYYYQLQLLRPAS